MIVISYSIDVFISVFFISLCRISLKRCLRYHHTAIYRAFQDKFLSKTCIILNRSTNFRQKNHKRITFFTIRFLSKLYFRSRGFVPTKPTFPWKGSYPAPPSPRRFLIKYRKIFFPHFHAPYRDLPARRCVFRNSAFRNIRRRQASF